MVGTIRTCLVDKLCAKVRVFWQSLEKLILGKEYPHQASIRRPEEDLSVFGFNSDKDSVVFYSTRRNLFGSVEHMSRSGEFLAEIFFHAHLSGFEVAGENFHYRVRPY